MLEFASRQEASAHVAQVIADSLITSLSKRGRASFVASGGSTPQECLRILSHAPLPWENIDVTLTDERKVPPDHPDSNERMVREQLLTDKASAASFIRLDDNTLDSMRPFDICLVGMGDDGHFASLFPDSLQLQEGLTSEAQTIDVSTPSSPYRRSSLTLRSILDSREIILLIFGENKKRIAADPAGYPIDKLLSQGAVNVIWAP